MIVMKFGGSSLRDAERIQAAGKLIAERLPRKPILVCSALGSTTDTLLALADQALHQGVVAVDKIADYHHSICKELGFECQDIDSLISELGDVLRGVALLKELSAKSRDYIVSFGERLAVRVMANYLTMAGVPSEFYESWDLGLRTDSNYGNAEIVAKSYRLIGESLRPRMEDYKHTPVVTGYIAKNAEGHITTLGRSGTDLTASVVGAAVGVEEIQLWKDVDGIMTTDPRIASGAQCIPQVSFEEASELAYFGAKVLHPLSIQPAMRKNIPVRVKNSTNPSHPGTEILGIAKAFDGLVKAITCKRNVTLVDIVSTRMLGQHGFLAKVFDAFNRFEVSVDMVATSEISVSLTLNQNDRLDEVVAELHSFATVDICSGKAILSLIGNVDRSSEILDACFGILKDNKVNVQMISQGASKVNIGLIVEDSEIETCVASLHEHFFEGAQAA